jgi:hypothetical protein
MALPPKSRVAAAAAFALAVHLGHDGRHAHAPQQRVAVLAVGGHDIVRALESVDDAGGYRLLADVEVQEAADLAGAVELRRFLLHAADAQHVGEQPQREFGLEGHRAAGGRGDHAPASRVEVSPSGRPSSRALSSRRMILPLRVWGRLAAKAISFGATAAPSLTLAWASSSLRSASVAS